ncbi:hypothetical protein HDV05_001549 [Chytridiales sp. JEL 0842]|nr:hypothetical protein HDV05_001549 [Chytridiales sp. JEL 0842]
MSFFGLSGSSSAVNEPPLDDAAVQTLVNNDLIQQAGLDFDSKPLLIFYSLHMPDPKRVNYDTLLSLIMTRLDSFVENDYTLVLFSSGAKHQPSWSWLYKAYQGLGRKYRKNLKGLYVVHPSGFLRFVIQMMGPIVSPKFSKKLYWIQNIDALRPLVPVPQIPIPQDLLDLDSKFPTNLSASLISLNLQQRGGVSQRKPNAGKHFGAPLETLMGPDGLKGLPRVVRECEVFVRQNGMETEGIFRRSPASQALQNVREAYDRGDPSIDLEAQGGVHLACVLIKLFFRELPVPVFPKSMYETLKRIEGLPTATAQIEYAKTAILRALPRPTLLLLASVLQLLHEVQLKAEKNLMSAHNLTIVFAPNLVKSENPMEDFAFTAVGGGGGGGGSSNGASAANSPTANTGTGEGDAALVGGGVGILVKLGMLRWSELFEDVIPVVSEENTA